MKEWTKKALDAAGCRKDTRVAPTDGTLSGSVWFGQTWHGDRHAHRLPMQQKHGVAATLLPATEICCCMATWRQPELLELEEVFMGRAKAFSYICPKTGYR
jgi:hypothetical protein